LERVGVRLGWGRLLNSYNTPFKHPFFGGVGRLFISRKCIVLQRYDFFLFFSKKSKKIFF
jgi:hypothetical protein